MDKNVISVKTVEEKRGKFSEYTSLQWWSLSDADFCEDVCVCVGVAYYVLNRYINRYISQFEVTEKRVLSIYNSKSLA